MFSYSALCWLEESSVLVAMKGDHQDRVNCTSWLLWKQQNGTQGMQIQCLAPCSSKPLEAVWSCIQNKNITGVGGKSLKCDKKRTSKDNEENSQSTIHGIGNIIDQKLNIVDCLLWLALVIAFDLVLLQQKRRNLPIWSWDLKTTRKIRSSKVGSETWSSKFKV